MKINKLNFNYNVSLNTINCIDAVDFTYHINHYDYPILHSHEDYWEFTLVSNGSIENIRNGQKEIIKQNMLIIATPSDNHYFNKLGNDELIIKNIICRMDAIEKIIKSLFGEEYYQQLLNGKKIYSLPQHIVNLFNNGINLANSYCETNWQKTNEILKSTIVSIISHLYTDDLCNNQKIEKWQKILNDLRLDPLFYTYNVNQLCERLGYSRVQLNRIFLANYNLTPHNYLLKAKLEYAASLLKYTDYSVNEISEMIGYNNINQFIDNFKNVYNDTPLRYRKKE